MNSKVKTVLVWGVLIFALIVAYHFYLGINPPQYVDFATFLDHVKEGRVESVRVHENQIFVRVVDPEWEYSTLGMLDNELTQSLSEAGIPIEWGEDSSLLYTLVSALFPIALFIGFWILLMKKGFGSSATNVLSLRKSPARLLSEERNATFADVGGCSEAKEQLGDVIHFLRDPKPWIESGARLPRGVLLEGPPGCGKTLLARAVAGETQARFYLISASEFVEMFVGIGAARVRDLFETARKNPPAVIFIDELDAVGRRRGSGMGTGHDEREQTLNQLLVSMDGFEPNDRIVVMAATNRPDILDPALVRPGRFDRRIKVPPLNQEARIQALRIHTRDKQLAPDVSVEELAELSRGFSGAEIERLANEAALLAVRQARGNGGGPATIRIQNFRDALNQAQLATPFNKLDSLLIGSVSQLSEPAGMAFVRLTLRDGTSMEGTVLWADSALIKIRDRHKGAEVMVPKSQLQIIEALEGTESASADDTIVDAWANRTPEVA